MDVRMQGLAPGMEDCGDAKLRAKMLGIGRDGGERLGRGAKQDRVDDGLVLKGDLTSWCRQSEDDVEIWHRQKLGLPIGEPGDARSSLALRAMAIAAGNGRRPLPALWANPVMGSWRVGAGIFL